MIEGWRWKWAYLFMPRKASPAGRRSFEAFLATSYPSSHIKTLTIRSVQPQAVVMVQVGCIIRIALDGAKISNSAEDVNKNFLQSPERKKTEKSARTEKVRRGDESG